MAPRRPVVAETLALIGEHARPGVTTAELDGLAEEFISAHGGYPTFKGYRGYPAAICISPNEMIVHGIPGAVRARGRRHPLGRRRRHPRRLRRRLRLHVRDRRDLRRGGAAARRRPGGAERRDRAVRGRQPALGHLPRGAAGDRGGRLLGRPQPRRPRRRPVDARGPADPELRPAGPRPAARRGDDVRDRADDQRRRARTSSCTTTSGRSRPPTARFRPISSTPWRSRRPARGS